MLLLQPRLRLSAQLLINQELVLDLNYELLTLVGPTPVIDTPNPISLPAPEDPALLFFVGYDLRCKPFLIPSDVAVWRKGRLELQVVRDTQTEFAHNHGPLTTTIVNARLFEICCWCLAGGRIVDAIVVGPFQISVIVVRCKGVICQILMGVACAPVGVLSLSVSFSPVDSNDAIPSSECAVDLVQRFLMHPLRPLSVARQLDSTVVS